jgi:hypothetical protein
VVAVLAGLSFEAHAQEVEPEGVWGCLIYGHQRLGNERMLLRFQPDGRTDMARPRADGFRVWMPLSEWTVRRRQLSFGDPRSGREFESDLRKTTLGGTWKTTSTDGGWWCSAIEWDLEEAFDGLQQSRSPDLMPPLVAAVQASPRYPRQAIRDGKEGRAVACFIVDSDGAIREPGLVELSDEIFRHATLQALASSTYRGWVGAATSRPGCRTFDYRLDSIY